MSKDVSEFEDFDKIFEAEYWVEVLSKRSKDNPPTPVDNFIYNIKMAKMLHLISKDMNKLWKLLHVNYCDELDIEPDSGEISIDVSISLPVQAYNAVTQHAWVCVANACEVYFRDKLASVIQNKQEILNRYKSKSFKLTQIMNYDLDLNNYIGKLVVEKINFWNLYEINKEYNRVLGLKPFDDKQIKKFEFIYQTRHMIVHNGGIVNGEFKNKFQTKKSTGDMYIIKRKKLEKMIEYVYNVINKLDNVINKKYDLKKSSREVE